MPALIALGRQVVGALLGTAATGAVLELATPNIDIFGFGGGGNGGGGGGMVRRRRRRRKAMTASDFSMALTIAASISKKAAEVFILQRTRAS